VGRSDDELIADARRGDERAFEQLLVRHEARVLRVLRLLGVAQRDREDVAQEVFVRVFRHLDGFRTGQAFEAWVYRIAVNATHDHRLREARRRESGSSVWRLDVERPDETADPERRLDLRAALERALESLSERERAVFVLCEMEGLGTRAVAAALGITSITVRRHLGRARARLQQSLAGLREKISPD